MLPLRIWIWHQLDNWRTKPFLQLYCKNLGLNVIENKLTEHYSNVTDSILNLLIKYHNYNSKEIEKYYSMVISKTFGQSLQIKKKSIKLLMHIYRSSSNSSIMDKIFETLVLKLADPDHFIVEFVTEELLNLIFVSIGRRFHHETTSIVKIKLDLNWHWAGFGSSIDYIHCQIWGTNIAGIPIKLAAIQAVYITCPRLGCMAWAESPSRQTWPVVQLRVGVRS